MRHLPSLLSVCLLSVVTVAAEVHVVGSDLLGRGFAARLAEVGRQRRQRLEVAFTGSRPGVSAVEEGRAEIGLCLLPLDETPPNRRLFAWPVGHFAVAVVVDDTLPLRRITTRQLAALFGDSAAIPLNRWGELDLDGEWRDRPIALHAAAPASGPGFHLFRQAMLRNGPVRPDVAWHDDDRSVAAAVQADPGALGLVSLTAVPAAGLRVLPVAAGPEEPAVAPAADVLERGTYPLRVPLCLVFRRENVPQLAELVRFLASAEGAGALQAAGFVPLTEAGRERLLAGLEALR